MVGIAACDPPLRGPGGISNRLPIFTHSMQLLKRLIALGVKDWAFLSPSR
jgi:hypothetical protein